MSETASSVVTRLLGILEGPEAAVPKSVVEIKLAEEFSSDMSRDAIRYALANFLVDLVVDYPERKWGIRTDRPIWQLRRMSSEHAKMLQALAPAKLALVRLLQQQDDPDHVGEMRERDVRARLAKEGFTAQDLRSLWIDDMVDSWWAFEGDEKVERVRLIPEDEKTEDFKREEERIAMMAIDRESREIRAHEEYEKEQLQKQKRKSRTAKKTSRAQSI